jgi:hypothetical protein
VWSSHEFPGTSGLCRIPLVVALRQARIFRETELEKEAARRAHHKAEYHRLPRLYPITPGPARTFRAGPA